MARQYLQIPGPTNIPESIRQAMSQPAINHRSHRFSAMLQELKAGLQYVFQSSDEILIFPSSGSGGLEAAIVNLFSAGDYVIAVDMGVFSHRFGIIAQSFGLNVIWIEVKWGRSLSTELLEKVLIENQDKNIAGILLTHSETSTGVLNDIAALKQTAASITPQALILVDAVSSLAISDLQTAAIGLDVVIAGSQKGLMLPGGLSILCVSDRAWEAHEKASLPRWYWNFKPLRERMELGLMVYTPAIAHFCGLEESLRIIRAEGLPNLFQRHKHNARAVQQGVEALGLRLLVRDPRQRAESVTAIYLPAGLSYQDLAFQLAELNIIIGGGLKKLEGQIFRIGHLGMLHEPEVLAIIGGLEIALKRCNYSFQFGVGTAAVANYYSRVTSSTGTEL